MSTLWTKLENWNATINLQLIELEVYADSARGDNNYMYIDFVLILPFEFVSEVETAQGLEWDKGHFGF